jgi:hypothetical protein
VESHTRHVHFSRYLIDRNSWTLAHDLNAASPPKPVATRSASQRDRVDHCTTLQITPVTAHELPQGQVDRILVDIGRRQLRDDTAVPDALLEEAFPPLDHGPIEGAAGRVDPTPGLPNPSLVNTSERTNFTSGSPIDAAHHGDWTTPVRRLGAANIARQVHTDQVPVGLLQPRGVPFLESSGQGLDLMGRTARSATVRRTRG